MPLTFILFKGIHTHTRQFQMPNTFLKMDFPVSTPHQKLPKQTSNFDSKHWNSILTGHTKLRNDRAILTTYTQMESLGISPDSTTLPLVLKACARLKAVDKGKKIHKRFLNTNFLTNVRVQTALVDFYMKSGLLDDAGKVFDEMSVRDVISWNAMISGCVSCCEYEMALLMFDRMQKADFGANSVTVVALLLACGELMELRLGKAVHGYCVRNGLLESNFHVGTALMGFYLKFDMRTTFLVFDSMDSRNTVSWNAMLSGCFDSGDHLKALELFVRMLVDGYECDYVTMLVVIQACAELGSLRLCMQVHQLAIKLGFSEDLYIVNALMNMYSNTGSLRFSRVLFGLCPTRDVALWNSMISAYVDSGFVEEAVSLFNKMQLECIKGDERTVVIMLLLCVDLENGLAYGKRLHAYALKNWKEWNTHLGNALLSFYADLNCLEEVKKVFGEMRDADVISFNILISALARNELRIEAWEIFRRMQESDIKPNSHTIVSILAAFSDRAFLSIGKSIHGYVVKHGIEVDSSLNTAMTEMYINCSDETTALGLFESLDFKDLISWNSLITSYVRNNQAEKALLLFDRMISEVEPNSVTIINVLASCTDIANLPQGRCLHVYAMRRELLDFDLPLCNAFISMYVRCGCMAYAENMFHSISRRNIVSWNAIISGYGMHGRGHDAMLALSQMLEDGIVPNEITFVSALSACSHSGLIEKGLQLFDSMVQEFSIAPKVVHYACMVDLLARGGRLNEAKDLIDTMPMAPDASVWRALLGGCRVYSDVKLAESASAKLVELEPTNAGNYVLLSNIYAAAGLWSKVKKLRSWLEKEGLKKPPGKSWIIIRSEVHCFAAGDKSHQQSAEVYRKLSLLVSLAKENGYVPDLQWVLHDEEDERKMKRLLCHSEKLAVAFGLINVAGGSPIMVTKNLRICGDCHEFSKHISLLSRREIVIRDGSRFHHFVDGFCSCKDYW